MKLMTVRLAAGLAAAALVPPVAAQDTAVARVNGRVITEQDVRLADAEMDDSAPSRPTSAGACSSST